MVCSKRNKFSLRVTTPNGLSLSTSLSWSIDINLRQRYMYVRIPYLFFYDRYCELRYTNFPHFRTIFPHFRLFNLFLREDPTLPGTKDGIEFLPAFPYTWPYFKYLSHIVITLTCEKKGKILNKPLIYTVTYHTSFCESVLVDHQDEFYVEEIA